MGTFTLSIYTDNAAFDDCPVDEVIQLLEEATNKLYNGWNHGALFDRNGNRVGRFELDH